MSTTIEFGLEVEQATPYPDIRASGELVGQSCRTQVLLSAFLLQPGVFLQNQYPPHPDCMHSVHKIDDDINSQEQH